MGSGKQQLRQRRKVSNAVSASKGSSSSDAQITDDDSVGSRISRWFTWVRPILVKTVRVTFPPVFGLLSAAALSSEIALAAYLIFMILVVFIVILRTFYSILKTNDMTMIHFPTVHRADGTKFTQEPVSVLEYDKHLASYFTSEIPAFAVAAVWFYLWTRQKVTMLAYAAYAAYRITREPVFRIHFWKEEPSSEYELRRPFGLAPIFDSQTTPVTVVAGLRAFETMLGAIPAEKLIIIDAAATWCAPCKAMAPKFEELAREHTDCEFLTIDVDVSADVAAKLEITSIPTILFYKGGEQLEVIRGPSVDKIRTTIQKHK